MATQMDRLSGAGLTKAVWAVVHDELEYKAGLYMRGQEFGI